MSCYAILIANQELSPNSSGCCEGLMDWAAEINKTSAVLGWLV